MEKIIKKIKEKIQTKKGILFFYKIAGLVLVLAILIIIPQRASAQLIDIGKTVADITQFFSKIIINVASWLIQIVINLIIEVAQYGSSQGKLFSDNPAVTTGWSIVRDICNMFFIPVFLVMAVATILKIEKYSWKKLLLPLALMAIFVNFSLTISLILVDASQVVMLTFVNAFKDVGRANLINVLGLSDIMSAQPANIGNLTGSGIDNFQRGAIWVMAACVSFIALVVLAIILVILALRIIAILFLLILSPFAFLFSIIPGMPQSLAKKWQDTFVSQLIVGPAMAFFIWLAFTAMSETNKSWVPGINGGVTVAGTSPRLTSFGMYSTFIFGAGMLIGGLMAAKQLGVAGASLAGKGISFLQKSGATSARWANRRIDAARKKVFQYGGSTAVRGIAAVPKSLGLLLQGRGRDAGRVWTGGLKQAAAPLVSFGNKVKDLFSVGSVAESDPSKTFGWEHYRDQLFKKHGVKKNPDGTIDQSSMPKDLNAQAEVRTFEGYYDTMKSQRLTEKNRSDLVDYVKKTDIGDKKLQEQYQAQAEKENVYVPPSPEKMAEGLGEIADLLERIFIQQGKINRNDAKQMVKELMGSGTKNSEGKYETFDITKSLYGSQIHNIIEQGGDTSEVIKNLTEQMSDKIATGTIGNIKFDGKKIDQIALEDQLQETLPKFIPIPGEETAELTGGARGLTNYLLKQIEDKYTENGKPNPAIHEALYGKDGIQAQLETSFKMGTIKFGEKEKIKTSIQKQLDNLVKTGDLGESESSAIKTKLYTQLDVVPVEQLTKGELVKKIVKGSAKWSGAKLNVPLSLVASTLENIADNKGIPLDLDIIMKDIRDFNARRTRKREADKMGQWHDVMNLWASFGKEKTNFKAAEVMRRANEDKQGIMDKTQGETHATLQELLSAWQGKDYSKAVAATIILAENNDLNEIFKGEFFEKFRPALKDILTKNMVGEEYYDKKSGKTQLVTPAIINKVLETAREKGEVNPAFMRAFTREVTTRAGQEAATAAKLANMIGMISLDHGAPHMGYATAAFNPTTEKMQFSPLKIFIDDQGRFDITLSKQTMAEIDAKLKNMSQRKVFNMLHPGMFAQEDINGNMRGLNDVNKSFLLGLEASLLERPHEMRADVISKLTASTEWQNSIADLVNRMLSNPMFFLKAYSEKFASVEDVLKQAELLRQLPLKLKASRYKKIV